MKRVIISTLDAHRNFNIRAGVQIKKGRPIFNWRSDSPTDVISLCTDTSGEFNDEGIRYVYGCQYNANATSTDKRILRNYLKHVDELSYEDEDDVQEFIESAVLRFDERYGLSNFQATVYIEPSRSPSIVEIMDGYMGEYFHNDRTNFKVVKAACEHVTFDSEKAIQAMRETGEKEDYIQRRIQRTLKDFEKYKKQGKLFEMKKYVPRALREGFSNFLKFATEDERHAYEILQGVDVLIYDDFLTSGATVKELIRYLRSIHDKNTLTIFVLLKQ